VGEHAIAVEVLYTGRVQGVGFRWRTLRIAQRHAVGGWVRNLPDGRVKLVAEGAAGEVDAFLADVRSKMGALVADEARTEREISGSYAGFDVRH
jgi:acylphosphatase